MAGKEGQVPKSGAREWLMVVLGSLMTFFFSFYFYGWASLQALLEEDGVYAEVCQVEDSVQGSCAERTSRMILLFTVCNLVTVLSLALLGLLVDRLGPARLSLVGGMFQAGGLLLLASTPSTPSTAMQAMHSPFDGYLLAFGFIGVGGAALTVQAMKLPFVVPPRHFALVMTLLNCLVDSSSVAPLGLYRLYLAGLSRFSIFAGYGAACLLLSLCLACCWWGRPEAILRALNAEELRAAEPVEPVEPVQGPGTRPRLHGLTLWQQIWSLEFAVAAIFLTTQFFRSSAYLGINKDWLASLGDDETENTFAQLFTGLLPASTLLVPLFNLSFARGGFAFTFGLVMILGFVWGLVVLVPWLQLQVVAFSAFTVFRGLLFAVFFTFVGHSFGNRTFSKMTSACFLLSASMSWLIWPIADLSRSLTDGSDGFALFNLFMLALSLPSVFMTYLLAKHLRQYPAGDICVCPGPKTKAEGQAKEANAA